MDPEIELLRNNSKNVNDFLCDITDDTKYNTTQIYANLKNCLVGKTANIYSCGPSFTEYKDKMPMDEDTIKICIKGTYNIVKNPDIFIFDNRIKAGNRVDDKYELHNKFKIFMGDYYFNNFKGWINNLPPVYKYPTEEAQFQNANLILTPGQDNMTYLLNGINLNIEEIQPVHLFNTMDNNNKIFYGNYNIFFPLVYRLLLLFDYMGVKKFNITGVDGFNPDFSQNHYFEKNSRPKFIGYDGFVSTFFDYILDYSKFDITMYSDKSNANIQIPRYKKMDLSYHFSNKLKMNTLTLPDTITNTNHILLLQMIHCLAINDVKCNVDITSIPVDKIIEILEQKKLQITLENIINHVVFKKFPNDFNAGEYKQLHEDLKHMTDLEASIHYNNHGITEGRRYK
jgi:hypothetical protein